jgi:hypothetical protein
MDDRFREVKRFGLKKFKGLNRHIVPIQFISPEKLREILSLSIFNDRVAVLPKNGAASGRQREMSQA